MFKKVLVSILSCALLFSGCASNNKGKPKESFQLKVAEDEESFDLTMDDYVKYLNKFSEEGVTKDDFEQFEDNQYSLLYDTGSVLTVTTTEDDHVEIIAFSNNSEEEDRFDPLLEFMTSITDITNFTEDDLNQMIDDFEENSQKDDYFVQSCEKDDMTLRFQSGFKDGIPFNCFLIFPTSIDVEEEDEPFISENGKYFDFTISDYADYLSELYEEPTYEEDFEKVEKNKYVLTYNDGDNLSVHTNKDGNIIAIAIANNKNKKDRFESLYDFMIDMLDLTSFTVDDLDQLMDAYKENSKEESFTKSCEKDGITLQMHTGTRDKKDLNYFLLIPTKSIENGEEDQSELIFTPAG